MKETVTVEKALMKGMLKLVFVPVFVIIGSICLSYFLKKEYHFSIWIYPVGFVVGFVISWLLWSYWVVEWKLWAFENVRNVNELERKAIQKNMIWPRNSWFSKTEIWNYDQKQQWKRIEKKFMEEDVYDDDLSVPAATRLYHAKSEIYFSMVLGCVFVFISIFLYGSKDSRIWMITPLFGVYFFYKGMKKFLSRDQPQMFIDGEGVYFESEKKKFLWERILLWQISSDKSGSYFKFMYTDEATLSEEDFHEEEQDDYDDEVDDLEDISIEIQDFDINVAKIEKLLRVYQTRFRNNQKNQRS